MRGQRSATDPSLLKRPPVKSRTKRPRLSLDDLRAQREMTHAMLQSDEAVEQPATEACWCANYHMLNEGCLNGTEPSTRNAQGEYVNPEYAAVLAAEDAAEAAKTRGCQDQDQGGALWGGWLA